MRNDLSCAGGGPGNAALIRFQRRVKTGWGHIVEMYQSIYTGAFLLRVKNEIRKKKFLPLQTTGFLKWKVSIFECVAFSQRMCLAMESTFGSKQLHKITETHDKTLSLYFIYILWVWPTINTELDASRAVFKWHHWDLRLCQHWNYCYTKWGSKLGHKILGRLQVRMIQVMT